MEGLIVLNDLNDYAEEKGNYLSEIFVAFNVFKETMKMEENYQFILLRRQSYNGSSLKLRKNMF